MSTTLDTLPETMLEAPFKWDKPFKNERWLRSDSTAHSILVFATIVIMFVGMVVGLVIQSITVGQLNETATNLLPIGYAIVAGIPGFIFTRKYLAAAKKRWMAEFDAFREEKGAVLSASIRSLGVFQDEERIQWAAYSLAGGGMATLYTPEKYQYVAEIFNKTVLLRLRGHEIHEKIRLASTAQRLGIPLADKSEVQVKAELWVHNHPDATLLDAYLAGNKG